MGSQITKSKQFRRAFPTTQFRILPSDPCFPDLMILQQMSDFSVLAAVFLGQKHKQNEQNLIKNKHVLMRKQKYEKDKNLYHVYEWATANVQGLVDFTTKIDQKRKITKAEYKAILQGAIRGYYALYRQTFDFQSDHTMECLCINMNNLKIFNQVVLNTNQKNSKEIINKMIVKVIPHNLNTFMKLQENNNCMWPNVGQCIHKGGVLTEKELLGMYMLQLGNYALKMDFKNKKDNMKNLKIHFGSHVERIIDALLHDYEWKIIIKELDTQYISETQKSTEEDRILTNQLKDQISNRQTLRRVQSNQNLYQNNKKVTQIQTIQRLQQNQNIQKARKDFQFQEMQARYQPRISEIQSNQLRQTTTIQRVQNIQQARNRQQNQLIGQYSHRGQIINQGNLFHNFKTQGIQKKQIPYKKKQIQQGSHVQQIKPVTHQVHQLNINQQIQRNENIQHQKFQNIQQTQKAQLAQIAQQFIQVQNKNLQIQQNNFRGNKRNIQRGNQREDIKKIQQQNQRQNYQQYQQQNNQQINQNIQKNYRNIQPNQQNQQNYQNQQILRQVYHDVRLNYHQNNQQNIQNNQQNIQNNQNNQQKYEQYPIQYQQQLTKPEMTSLKVLPSSKTSTIRLQQKLPKTQNNLFSFFRKQQQQNRQISQQIISPEDDTSFLQQLNKKSKQIKQRSGMMIPHQQIDPNIRKQHSRVIIYGNNQQPYDQYQLINKINRMNSNQYYRSVSPVRTQQQTYISPVSIKNIQQEPQPVCLLGNSRETLINKLEQQPSLTMKKTSSFLAHITNNQNFTYDQQRGIFVSNKILGQYFSPQPNPTYIQINNVTPPKRKQSVVVPVYQKQQKIIKQVQKIDKNQLSKKRKGKKISCLISQPNDLLALPNLSSYQTKTKPDFCENQFFIKEQQRNIKQSSNNLKGQIKGFLSHQFNGLGFSLNQKNFNRSSKQANKLQLPVNPLIMNHKPKIPVNQIPPRHDQYQKNQQNNRKSLQKLNNMNQKNQKVQYIQSKEQKSQKVQHIQSNEQKGHKVQHIQSNEQKNHKFQNIFLNQQKSQKNHDSMRNSLNNNKKQKILISQSWQLNDQIHLNSSFHQKNERSERQNERSQRNNNQNYERQQRKNQRSSQKNNQRSQRNNERSQRNNRHRRNQRNQQNLSRNSYNQQQNQQQQVHINIKNHQQLTNNNNEDFNPRKVKSNIQNLNIKQANSQVLILGVSKSPKSIKNNNNNNSESNSIVKSEQVLQQRKESKYIGPVNIKGQKQGQGKIFFLSGGCYIGHFVKDFMHGQGKLYYPSGKLAYEGTFQHDKFHGYGKLYNQSPCYIVNFDFRDFNKMQVTQKQQPIHKQHFLINPIKSQKKISYWKMYEGEMMHDMKNGKGILLLENGEKFVGEFINDLVHGKGMFYGNTNTIEGVWQENMLVEVHR